jgi:ABC-type tungstate transport system permease subunit
MCFAIAFSFFTDEANAFDPRLDPGKTVMVAEFTNSPAAQLLLMAFNNSFAGLTEAAPAWKTLPSDTVEEREELKRASVVGAYDIVFVSDFEVLSALFDQGLLRSFFPVFSEEIVLVGPVASEDITGESAAVVMERVYREKSPFLTLMSNEWSLRAELEAWRDAGVESPEENRNYIQSSRDDVTALFQAGDEGAFLMVGEGAFAQYTDSQRAGRPLERIAGTGVFRKCYAGIVKGSGFRRERTEIAGRLADWLKTDEAGEIARSFEIGAVKPFHSDSPLL